MQEVARLVQDFAKERTSGTTLFKLFSCFNYIFSVALHEEISQRCTLRTKKTKRKYEAGIERGSPLELRQTIDEEEVGQKDIKTDSALEK